MGCSGSHARVLDIQHSKKKISLAEFQSMKEENERLKSNQILLSQNQLILGQIANMGNALKSLKHAVKNIKEAHAIEKQIRFRNNLEIKEELKLLKKNKRVKKLFLHHRSVNQKNSSLTNLLDQPIKLPIIPNPFSQIGKSHSLKNNHESHSLSSESKKNNHTESLNFFKHPHPVNALRQSQYHQNGKPYRRNIFNLANRGRSKSFSLTSLNDCTLYNGVGTRVNTNNLSNINHPDYSSKELKDEKRKISLNRNAQEGKGSYEYTKKARSRSLAEQVAFQTNEHSLSQNNKKFKARKNVPNNPGYFFQSNSKNMSRQDAQQSKKISHEIPTNSTLINKSKSFKLLNTNQTIKRKPNLHKMQNRRKFPKITANPTSTGTQNSNSAVESYCLSKETMHKQLSSSFVPKRKII